MAFAGLFAVISVLGGIAYYSHDVRQAEARLGLAIAAAGPVESPRQASAAALRAGFRQSDALLGQVDRIARVPAENRSIFDFWAVDTSPAPQLVFASIFRQGRLVAALSPAFTRADIAQRYGTKLKTAFHFEVVEPCRDAPAIVILYTRDKRFTVLPVAGQSSACRE